MILLLVCISAIWSFQQTTGLTMEEMDVMKIYYDEKNIPVPMLTNVSDVVPALKTPNVRFGPLPCSCNQLTCGCCVNMNINLFNFRRHACTNFTYDPYEFSIGMNMLWNEQSIYQNSISAKNPPPICIQAPIPYLPAMDQCVRLFKIFTPGRNLHMCMNLETRFERVPVLVLQFDCMRMGADGVALLKPEAEGGLKPPEETEETSPETPQEAANIFDPVDPEKRVNQTFEENSDKNNGTDSDIQLIDENNKTDSENKTLEASTLKENSTQIEITWSLENTTVNIIQEQTEDVKKTELVMDTMINSTKEETNIFENNGTENSTNHTIQ